MVGVTFHAQDTPMPVEETVETCPERSDPNAEGRDDMDYESLPQPLVNFLADVIPSQNSECSQAPTGGATVAPSQQPSPELLMSLGVKVRDFAYENTLPAIVPVPRVPRQVQPAPRALKRLHRDWDDKEGSLNNFSSVRSLHGQVTAKKPRSLERKATEPLQEPVVQHTRTLDRIKVKRVYSLLIPPSRRTLPTTPCTRFSTSPPTSPLTPLPSHSASHESDIVQTSSTFPFAVRVDNPAVIPTSQLDSGSQPVSLHPVLYTRPPGCSSAPGPSENLNASPAPLLSSFLEVPSPIKEPRVDLGVCRRRARGTQTPSNRYQLRQRPIPSSRASTLPHQVNATSKPLSRRTRRVR